jgi:hypothetical protein
MRRLARRDGSLTIPGGIGQNRIDTEDRVRAVQQAMAARTVAGNALDVRDCRELLCMLGLSEPTSKTAPAHSRAAASAGRQEHVR